MRVFHCDHCGHLLFFENTQCVRCGQLVAYLPDLSRVGSLDQQSAVELQGSRLWDQGFGSPTPDPGSPSLWHSPAAAQGRAYRLCINYVGQHVCNWAVESSDPNLLCVSCRLTRIIPDLAAPEHHAAWYRLESAKRRLIFTLLQLGLPIVGRGDDPHGGLSFEFTSDGLTGHASGVITVNIAEAVDAERERQRTSLREPYRTLLGHFRHESGHYYWDRLVRYSAALDRFRTTFGDERLDYGEALNAHYFNGPRPDWRDHYISPYAAAHPLEDWAESWTHYLHMHDTLETAAACGISLCPPRSDEPAFGGVSPDALVHVAPFDRLIESWLAVTYALNNLNRGMGLVDPYPFVWSTSAIEKLRFVHDVVCATRSAAP